MGMMDKVLAPFRKKNTLSRYGTLEEAEFWTDISFNHALTGSSGHMRVMAALRAGLVIAQGIGQMPLHVKHTSVKDNKVYRRNAVEERAYKLLNRRPNDWMTSIELRESLTLHAVFTGAGRALIVRGVDGRPIEILPLHPTWCDASYDHVRREHIYKVAVSEYGIYGEFTRDDILEITNPRWDFVRGLDITRQAAGALGLASNLEGRQAKLTAQNSPYGIISTENGQSRESIQVLRTAWTKQFGAGNGVGILDFDAKFQQMMGTAQDQQTIENRKFQVEEVARAYGVFSQMLMAGDNMNFASVEAFFLAHWTHTISPWAERWEQALDRTFFDNNRKLSACFDEKALLRTALQDKAEYLARALGSGGNKPWLTQNEARAMEGLDPHPEGDGLDMEVSQNGTQITKTE